jgi:glucose-6-phosphate isomerase
MHEGIEALDEFVAAVRADGFTDAVLLGMGGSSLAPEVFRRSYEDADGLRLHVLDTTEPREIAAVADAVDLDRTLFIVSSKSGGTIEPNSLFKHFWGRKPDGAHFVAITDPDTSLGRLAAEHGFRRTFVNDPEIGGRYSALSYFGLVPAALAGIDVEGQLHASEVAEQNCLSPEGNSGLWLGAALGTLAGMGRDKLAFVIDEPIGAFGLWAEQLIAESTGKHGKGVLPIADEPLLEPEAYGPDRVFVHVRNADAPDSDHEAAVKALAQAGHPTITVNAHGAGDLGRLFFFSEFATAVAGWALEINPFDQPNVQEAKDATAKVLEEGVEDWESEPFDLSGVAPPNYVAIQGFVQPSADFDEAIEELRVAIRDKTRATTTFGYGPRYLHSTGQFHKGGPPTGVFLQLVHDGDDDIEIPGAGYSFRTLKNAQAQGDYNTLEAHNLPVTRIRLEGDPAKAVRDLIKEIG